MPCYWEVSTFLARGLISSVVQVVKLRCVKVICKDHLAITCQSKLMKVIKRSGHLTQIRHNTHSL